jgi:hypothetical protein
MTKTGRRHGGEPALPDGAEIQGYSKQERHPSWSRWCGVFARWRSDAQPCSRVERPRMRLLDPDPAEGETFRILYDGEKYANNYVNLDDLLVRKGGFELLHHVDNT